MPAKLKLLILLLIPMISWADGDDITMVEKVDSVYRHLSTADLANRLVWTSLSDEHTDKINPETINQVGGLLFSRHHAGITNQGVTKALQLDHSLLPTPNSSVPNLVTLSSLRDDNLFNQYCRFLLHEGMKEGYHYLILPELSESESHLVTTLQRIKETNPDYFLYRHELAFEPDPRRKRFYPLLMKKKALVIPIEKIGEFKKTLSKGPKSVEAYENSIRRQIAAYFQDEPVLDVDTSRLFHDIWVKSVIPLEKQAGILPIKNDTIGIWVNEEHSTLKSELERYFGTVLNLKYDDIPAGIPVIVDGRSNATLALEYAFAFQRQNHVLWLASESSLIDVSAAAILYTHEYRKEYDEVLTKMIIGAETISGRFDGPIPAFLIGYDNRKIHSQRILTYGNPRWHGMKSYYLDSIDLVAREMIAEYATPGAQILIAKDGEIVFDQSYGYLTYDSLFHVDDQTLYDLASLTKVTSTTLALMKLYEDGLINLDSSLAHYLPDYKSSNKSNLTLRQLLMHQAGLMPYIPFWKRSMKGDRMNFFYYQNEDDEANDIRSYGYKPDPVMKDSLQNWIRYSRLIRGDKSRYKYSDLGFMILHEVIETQAGMSLERYLQLHFYGPLGLERTMFNPLTKGFERYDIAPTEYDTYLRREQVWGSVHDRNAVVFGGIAGHAGLFSNAKDLAVIMQMILQDGQYGGEKFLNAHTIDHFNHRYSRKNRRGLGWDKIGDFNPNVSERVSKDSFGHTGFTGTMVWADPKYDLVYIFLSNRIFPDAKNQRLITMDVRKRIHDLIYKSIAAY